MKHLNLLLLVSSFALISTKLYSQAAVSSTSIEKESREVVMIKIEQPPDITADALEARMKRSGLSGKGKSDVLYKAVILNDISIEKVDIYTKVEKGKDKFSCVVYMAVSKGYENFAKASSDKAMFDNMKNFLNAFVKDVTLYALELDIKEKADELRKEEKRYANLIDDEKGLQKDKVNIEASIVNKQKEIKDKKEVVGRTKDELEKLNSKKAAVK